MKWLTERRYRLPRLWSNDELRKIAPLIEGNILNVSGWQDSDKEGDIYKNYFINASEYTISNYDGYRGYQSSGGELNIDLTASLPKSLEKKFDAVFNHTTLEHIFDVSNAVRNLCFLSKNIVIVVVPVAQIQHESDSWSDYWRFTPSCMRKLFELNGLSIVYESVSRSKNSGVYLFMAASYFPEQWLDKLPCTERITDAASSLGQNILIDSIHILKSLYTKVFCRL